MNAKHIEFVHSPALFATVRAGLLGLLLATGMALAETPAESQRLEEGRELTRALFSGKIDTLVDAMNPDSLAAIGGAEALEDLSGRLQQLGPETRVEAETVYAERGTDHYYRVAGYEQSGPTNFTTQLAWNRDDKVVAVGVQAEPADAEPASIDEWPELELALPFRGEWYVQWGGDRSYENYHVSAPDQRFANDFLVVREGRSHEGAGERNGDYHCFGKAILAPAAGEVVRAADGVADNTPGEMNREQLFGNHVVIDHGDSRYSVLAHLRRGSVAVTDGDTVQTGERLGECGNSGHSSEPHLHYHLQDSPRPGESEGIPAPFSDYRADGDPVARDRPRRGDFIRPPDS